MTGRFASFVETGFFRNADNHILLSKAFTKGLLFHHSPYGYHVVDACQFYEVNTGRVGRQVNLVGSARHRYNL